MKSKTQNQSTLKLAHKINDCWSWQADWKTRTLLAFSFGKTSKLLPGFDIRSESWRVREKRGKCLPISGAEQISRDRKPHAVCSVSLGDIT